MKQGSGGKPKPKPYAPTRAGLWRDRRHREFFGITMKMAVFLELVMRQVKYGPLAGRVTWSNRRLASLFGTERKRIRQAIRALVGTYLSEPFYHRKSKVWMANVAKPWKPDPGSNGTENDTFEPGAQLGPPTPGAELGPPNMGPSLAPRHPGRKKEHRRADRSRHVGRMMDKLRKEVADEQERD